MKWRISVGDIWYWDAFHDDTDYGNAREYPLQAGEHVLTLANCADSVELDRLFYSSIEGDVPTGNDTPCHPPHSIELAGGCQLSCGSQGGNQCGTVCNDHQPFLRLRLRRTVLLRRALRRQLTASRQSVDEPALR